MVVVLRKPAPFTVTVSDAAPAVTADGLIELTVGAVCDVVVPPEFEEEPQPESNVEATRVIRAANPSNFLIISQEYTVYLTATI
jgi:hypothetical protein